MTDALAVVSDPLFAELKAFLIEKTGLVYFRDKDADLAQRLLRRFRANGDASCAGYLARLRADGAGEEFDALVMELTIGETYFFRHREQFDALRDVVLPDAIARNAATRSLRFWCAGCSIGAEPYSIAILLADHFAAELRNWDVRIVGTDLNRDFLRRAREGVFDEWAFRTNGFELRGRHFRSDGKRWVLNDDVKRRVEFHHHNLLAPLGPPAGGAFDLIFCRNVMIYFDWPTVAAVMPTFERNLVEGGWLVIGHAEQPHGAKDLVARALPGVTVYQKRTATPLWAAPAVSPALTAAPPPAAPPAPARPLDPGELAHLRSLADRGLFTEATQASNALIARAPDDARPLYYRALVHEQMGRAGEARADLARAVELDQTFVMAHYLLALHQRGARDQRAAARSFHRALFLLDRLPSEDVLPEGDALTVAELRVIIGNYLEAA